jgi:hypothetical protein
MAKVTFTIYGPKGAVTLRAMLLAFQNQLAILNDLDTNITGTGEPVLEWVVSDITAKNSVTGTLASQPRHERIPLGHDARVARTYYNGWTVIEGEARTPEYYSDRGLRAAKSTLKLIGREGVTGYSVESDLTSDGTVELTARAAVNVDLLIKPGQKAIGSIEGRLSVISLKTKTPRLEIVTSVGKKVVSCQFAASLLDDVKAALGKRVLVSGTIVYNSKGEPQKIAMDPPIRLLHQERLPSTSEMSGAFPDLTGDLTTAQYLELVRG